jgi:predicted ArsR family transcriptional regulator
MTPSPDLAILRWLARRTQAAASAIGAACAMAPSEVRARLVMLESQRLVAGRSLPDASGRAPQRIYIVTGEGRRKAGIGDARQSRS